MICRPIVIVDPLPWEPAGWGIMAERGTWEARVYLETPGRWRWRVWHRGCLLMEGLVGSEDAGRERAEAGASLSEGDRKRMIWLRSKRKSLVVSTA